MKAINEIIRSLREDKDLTQANISEILGIVQQTYSTYETGESEIPSRHIKTLAIFYHISADYLLGITEYKGTVSDINEAVSDNITLGKLLSDIMELDKDSKRAIVEYVKLLELKLKL